MKFLDTLIFFFYLPKLSFPHAATSSHDLYSDESGRKFKTSKMSLTYLKFQSQRMDQRPGYGFSHRLRAAVEKDQITPSPLDYFAEKVSLGRSSNSYSFGHRPRTNYVVDCTTPGPGEYFIAEEVVKKRKPGYSFGSRPGFKRPRSHTPGPKYLADPARSFQPKPGFSFGHRPKFGRKISVTPGPGEYDNNTFLFKETPAFSFGVKNDMRGRNDLIRNNTPSAASYRPETGKIKATPAYSFGTKSRKSVFAPVEFDSPGPGEYDTNRPDFNRQKSGFSFGLRVSFLKRIKCGK